MELESCGSLGQLVQAARAADDGEQCNFRSLRARAALCHAAADVADADVGLRDWWEAENALLKARAARVRESARVSDPAAPAAVLTLAEVRAVRDAFAAEVDFAVQEFLAEWDRQCEPAGDEEDDDMATSTKSVRSKSGRQKVAHEAWYTEAGELWWRCPSCRSAHNAYSRQKCPCDGAGSVRPKVQTLQEVAKAVECDALVKPLVKPQIETEGDDAPALVLEERHVKWLDDGETAVWECPACGQQGNALLIATCVGCGRTRTPQVPMPERPRNGKPAANGKPKQKATKGAKSKTPEPMATRTCNRCNTVHEAAVCPGCGCPEYRLEEAPGACFTSAYTSEPPEKGTPPSSGAGFTETFKLPTGAFLIIETRDVPLARIRERPDNPRSRFDAAALHYLAQSIADVGQQEPGTARLLEGGDVELWQGACRKRALEVLQRKTMRLRVYPSLAPDWLMIRGRCDENEKRADLDPIEAAVSLRQRLASYGWDPNNPAGPSLRSLAKQVGISQGELSLRLRLPDLPEPWRGRLIAREITPSHCRHMYPYLDLPAFGPALDAQFDNVLSLSDSFPPEKEFARDCAAAARAISRPMSRPISAAGYNSREACAFTVTKALRAELDVRDVPRHYEGGKAEPRAFNVELWERLQKEAKAAARKKEKAEQAAEKAKPKKKQRVPEWDRTPNTYRLERRLDEWTSKAMAPKLRKTDRAAALRLLLLFCAGDLGAIGEAVTGKAMKSSFKRIADSEVWKAVNGKSEKELVDLIVLAAQAALADGVSRGDLKWWLGVAGEFGVDLKAEWRPDVEDLTLYSVEQLRDLAKQFGHELPEKAKDQKAIAKHLVSVWRAGDVPKEFLRAAGVK